MTNRQIELVESSWDYIILNSKEAGLLFYDRLFSLDPALKGLFKENVATQANKLVAMITFVVHKLNNVDDLVKEVEALGKRHHNYHVAPEHYRTVADALLWTLERGMGDEWSDELKNAWIQAYSLLSTTMIEASQKTK